MYTSAKGRVPSSSSFFAVSVALALGVLSFLGSQGTASAQSHELRVNTPGFGWRWERVRGDTEADLDIVVSGFGFRRFGAGSSHGFLVEAEYSIGISGDSELFLARGGYVNRRAWALRSPHRWHALSIRGSLATGVGGPNLFLGSTRRRDFGFVIGARVGIDYDIHFRHFFMGWTLENEFLIRPGEDGFTFLQRSRTNFAPIARFGFTFGDAAF